jgi:cell division protease FtsH
MNDKENQFQNQFDKLPGFSGGDNGNFFRKWGPLLLLLLLFTIPWIVTLFSGGVTRTQVSYSFFIQQLNEGNIESVLVRGEEIQGTLKENALTLSTEGDGGGTEVRRFTTFYPAKISSSLISDLQGGNVVVYTQPEREGDFFTVLLNILPFLFIFWIIFRLSKRMRAQGGGLFNVGRNKAKKYEKKRQEETTFDDVAGIESAKAELKEIVDFLKKPDKYRNFGAKTPKGVLLVGPPGTGKTLLARAVAGEADVPFFSISGSDFMEMFVGVGASRVRNLFRDAKKQQPSIIFIDELDSIGRSRGAGLGGGHDEREQTLNQLLSELDGFEQDESTIVLAATNRPDILDPALQRPGRFDRQITTNLPPKKDRTSILRIHSKNKPLAESVDLERLASSTPGFSGADLANLLNEAALIAVKNGKKEIEQEDLDTARDKVILGLERKSVVMSDREKEIVAYHESGHALVAALLPNAEPVHKVTIIPRDRSMGATQQLPEEDRYLYELAYLQDRISVMMGGRAAEKLKTGTLTSGAENDLKEAQKLARKMVLDWGMAEQFENIAMGSQRQNVFLGEQIAAEKEYSEETNRHIDEAVQKLLTDAFNRATENLQEQEKVLDGIAEILLREEEISGRQIYEMLHTQ